MQVSIITPLFNRLDLTRAYLSSLESTLRQWRYEIILIDDGSTDGTRDFLRTLPPERCRIVLNDAPQGYAANNNAGARLARAPLLCLLNNDTVLLPRWLEPMARLANTLPDVAFVGNVQREPVSGLIDHYGIFFDHEGQAIHAGKNAAIAPAEDYLEWPAVTAACGVVRRQVFLDLGGFDETFRNGFEDVDFCLRAHTRGYRHFVANRSVIYHHVSASPGRKAHDQPNFRLFRERWLDRLTQEFRARQTLPARHAEGRRYLRKYRWQPWRYNFWRFARAVEQRWWPVPPPRRLDSLPRAWFRWQDRWRLRCLQQAALPAGPTDPIPSALIFLIVGNTAQNPAHNGVSSVVRNLAGAFGRIEAPVRLVHWEPVSRTLRLLPPDFSVGLDAESLRASPIPRADSASVPSLFDPAAARPDDPLALAPSLHELPAAVPPPGAWVLLPEVPTAHQTAPIVEYVHRHGWKLAVVFHDALATNEPAFFAPGVPHAHAAYLQAVSGADLVLPVSDFSAADWQRFVAEKSLPQPPVKTCRPAADTCVRARTTLPPSHREQGAPIRLLCVSAVAPRKNHRALLAAYELAIAARPDLNLALCCVGEYRVSGDYIDAALHAAMERYPGKVTWYEQVDYSALRRLYEDCAFTVYPSTLEGFGLPIIESLWFRRPCICANTGATNELAYGGGCLTTDVRDPQTLADAILSLADSPERLAALSNEIDTRGLRCWEEYARDVLTYLTPPAAS